MHKLSNMVAANEVLYGSKERDKARQEQWLAELYAPDARPAGLLSKTLSAMVNGMKAVLGQWVQKDNKTTFADEQNYRQKHAS